MQFGSVSPIDLSGVDFIKETPAGRLFGPIRNTDATPEGSQHTLVVGRRKPALERRCRPGRPKILIAAPVNTVDRQEAAWARRMHEVAVQDAHSRPVFPTDRLRKRPLQQLADSILEAVNAPELIGQAAVEYRSRPSVSVVGEFPLEADRLKSGGFRPGD
jgi:hypothetical protein